MSHRFAQVRDAMASALENSALVGGAGVNVFKARTRNVEGEPVAPGASSDLPAVSVYLGDDTPLGDLAYNGPALIDTDLQIFTDIWAETAEDDIDALLLKLRRRVMNALLQNDTLGLAFVHLVMPAGGEAPIRQNADRIRASYRLNWVIRLRIAVPDEGDGAFEDL
jgi:hypothetical protein